MSDKKKPRITKAAQKGSAAPAADAPAPPNLTGAKPVSTGPAPSFEAPDVYAPEVPDHPPGAPVVDATGRASGDPTGAVPEMRAPEAPSALAVSDDSLVTEDGGATAPIGAPAPAVHRPTRDARVGLFVGREWSFPPEFFKAIERRDAGVVAEYAKIGAPRFDEAPAYDLLIDRISHEVPTYRTYLKQAALRGAAVVNNPFMWSADDKFFGASLADRLGVASPKTVVLPNREYVPGIVPSESLRNLEYPLDWQGIIEYIGMPCILKDAHGGGWKEVYVCRTPQELLHNYNTSGLLTMIVQEFIEFEHFVRCLVIGRDEVLPMKYDPKQRKYIVDHAHLTPQLGSKIVRDARALCHALGYDMNSMEFAIRDGVPYAIDFMNPAPDMDIYSLTPTYFEWVVEHMADMAVRMATRVRDGGHRAVEPAWSSLFGGAPV
ncbi:MAG TPA: hypothetical protein VGD56_02100 [Gemmatirosa sp.]